MVYIITLCGVTQKQLKEIIGKQEAQQLFQKPNTRIYHFPVFANHKIEIFQTDIIDLSDIELSKNHYKYILACIDVCSRYVHCIPMKSKTVHTILNAMNNFLKVAT